MCTGYGEEAHIGRRRAAEHAGYSCASNESTLLSSTNHRKHVRHCLVTCGTSLNKPCSCSLHALLLSAVYTQLRASLCAIAPLSTASTGRYVQTLTAAEMFDHHLELILIVVLACGLGSSARLLPPNSTCCCSACDSKLSSWTDHLQHYARCKYRARPCAL